MKSVSPSESVSFDPMSRFYDQTRKANSRIMDLAFDRFAEIFPPHSFPRIFEPGIGTGRIAIPLAERGYRVSGVDISRGMLRQLKRNLEQSSAKGMVTWVKGDATQVPFHNGSFDAAIAVHLFYFIPNWKAALEEMNRVVAAGGPLILMHTGTGAEVPALNQRYKELCEGAGFTIRNAGVESTREVVDYMVGSGWTAETLSDGWEWEERISLPQALRMLSERAYSFTVRTPNHIHSRTIKKLRAEGDASYRHGTENTVAVANRFRFVILRKAGPELNKMVT